MNDEKKNRIKKILSFCCGCLVMLLLFGLAFQSDNMSIGLGTMIAIIPLALLGLLLWGLFRNSNKPLALGFLMGGILPFTVVFLLTGGCGIFI